MGKSFIVIDGDLRLLIERGEKMYVASSLDVRGLNTQGKTIEETIANAHDAAKLLAEYRVDTLRDLKIAGKKAAAARASASKRRVPKVAAGA